MPRQTRDSRIETRAARERLSPGRKPYFRGLEEGLHLGYRKPKSGAGAWLMRTRTEGGAYRETVVGKADDFEDADDELFLSFAQAQRRARDAWLASQRAVIGAEEKRGPYTVASAMADYEADFTRRGKKAIKTIRSVAAAHILPDLGKVALDRLTTQKIKTWHAGIAGASKMVRTGAGKARQHQEHDASDADAVRRRRSTANRILTVLKAALNFAFAEGKVSSDLAWRRVKPFNSVDAARVRFLTAAECTRLVNACDPPFRPLARAALVTGARYGELTRLTTADFDARARTIYIRESKSGKPRHIPLSDEGLALFRDVTAGRPGAALIFTRSAMVRFGANIGDTVERGWRSSEPDRFMQSASAAAQIEPAVRFHDLRHAYASLLVSRGVPLAFVAEVLGHSDTRITSRNYAHLAPSAVADSIRGALPRFNQDDATGVVDFEEIRK